MSFTTVVKGLVGAGILTAVGVGAGLYFYQNNLIYPANMPEGSRENVPTPSDYDMPYEEIDLVTPDGVQIKAYYIPAKIKEGGAEASTSASVKTGRTILMLHANAGNVGHRLPIAKVFWSKMGCSVVALSYRGYGRSQGSPSEKGIRLDAQTAMDYVLSHLDLQSTKKYLYGQSIGGAVSIDLASRNVNVLDGVIVENTFLSLPKLVPSILPALAPFVPYLLHQIWPSEQSILKFPESLPVLFLSGSRDELIPPAHVQGLWQLKRGKKKLIHFERGTHNDTVLQPGYFGAIQEFLDQIDKELELPEVVDDLVDNIYTEDKQEKASIDSESEFEMVSVSDLREGSIDPKTLVKNKLAEKL